MTVYSIYPIFLIKSGKIVGKIRGGQRDALLSPFSYNSPPLANLIRKSEQLNNPPESGPKRSEYALGTPYPPLGGGPPAPLPSSPPRGASRRKRLLQMRGRFLERVNFGRAAEGWSIKDGNSFLPIKPPGPSRRVARGNFTPRLSRNRT